MSMNKEQIRSILNSTDTNRQKYYRIYGERVSKDTARHRLDKLKRELLSNVDLQLEDIPVNKFTSKDQITINSNGQQCSEKVLDCSAEQIKDPTYLLNMHGYDPKQFELVSATASMWQNGSKEDTMLYSSKIHVKPIGGEYDLLEAVNNCIHKLFDERNDAIKPIDSKRRAIRAIKDDIHNKFLEICLPDLHIGLTENERSEDLEDFVELFDEKIERICNIVSHTEATMVDLVFLGDILHYDTAYKTTTKGTPQCSNVDFETVFTTAEELLIKLVNSVYSVLEELNSDTDLRILYVPGNHDTVLGFALMNVLEAYFHNNMSIHFDLRQLNRKYTLYGTNLVGFIHGDMNAKRLNQWLYTDARKYISNAKQIEVHCGHLHSEQVSEDNGMTVRHLPTICGQSPFEFKQGYSSVRRLNAFLWDSQQGLQNIYYV